MSTKIYDGWKCPTGDLLGELERLHALRPAVAAAGEAGINSWYAKRAAAIFDAGWASNTPATGILYTLMDELLTRQAQIQQTGRRDSVVDTECAVVLIPVDGHVLAYVRAFMPETSKAASTGMAYFGYWDNTDPQEGISDAEWAERERLWTLAIGRDPGDRPHGCGPVVEFLPNTTAPNAAALVPLIPDVQTRALRLARHALIQERIIPIQHTISPGQIIQITGSEAFEADMQARAADIAATLPAITIADLSR